MTRRPSPQTPAAVLRELELADKLRASAIRRLAKLSVGGGFLVPAAIRRVLDHQRDRLRTLPGYPP